MQKGKIFTSSINGNKPIMFFLFLFGMLIRENMFLHYTSPVKKDGCKPDVIAAKRYICFSVPSNNVLLHLKKQDSMK